MRIPFQPIAATIAAFAAATALTSSSALAARSMDRTAAVTVIGASDFTMCVRSMERESQRDAQYWCSRTIERGEAPRSQRAVAHLQRAILHLKRSDPHAALGDIDTALDLAPLYADAHLQRGNALFSLGRLDAAAEAYGTAIAQGTGAPELAHYNRGLTLERLGRTAEAAADFDRARSLAPLDSPLVERLARR